MNDGIVQPRLPRNLNDLEFKSWNRSKEQRKNERENRQSIDRQFLVDCIECSQAVDDFEIETIAQPLIPANTHTHTDR